MKIPKDEQNDASSVIDLSQTCGPLLFLQDKP